MNVNGTQIDPVATNSDTVWTFDELTSSISFAPLYHPNVGDVVTATYQRTCY